jgi:hypothetical protein
MEEENSKFTLVHLWQEVWREHHPGSKLSGHQLQRLLYRYEQNPVVRVRTAAAFVKKSEAEQGSDSPVPQPDEVLSVKPRNFVFPENDEEEDVSLTCYENVAESRGSVRKIFATLDRDVLRPNHPALEIPMVTGKPFPAGENSFRTPAKGYGFLEKTPLPEPELTFCHDEGKCREY